MWYFSCCAGDAQFVDDVGDAVAAEDEGEAENDLDSRWSEVVDAVAENWHV